VGKRISERERKRENLGTNLGGKREKKAKIHRKLVTISLCAVPPALVVLKFFHPARRFSLYMKKKIIKKNIKV
jgi:hypothetical protein